MIYTGKHFLDRSKIVFDELIRYGLKLNIYTGEFPTQQQIDATTWNFLTSYQQDSTLDWSGTAKLCRNEGLVSTVDYSDKRIAEISLNEFKNFTQRADGSFYGISTMKSVTADITAKATFFELVNYWGSSLSNVTNTCAQGDAKDANMNNYTGIYGIIGEVGTNNNLTISKQDLTTGDQFYVHDLYFDFNIDIDSLKRNNPTLV